MKTTNELLQAYLIQEGILRPNHKVVGNGLVDTMVVIHTQKEGVTNRHTEYVKLLNYLTFLYNYESTTF